MPPRGAFRIVGGQIVAPCSVEIRADLSLEQEAHAVEHLFAWLRHAGVSVRQLPFLADTPHRDRRLGAAADRRSVRREQRGDAVGAFELRLRSNQRIARTKLRAPQKTRELVTEPRVRLAMRGREKIPTGVERHAGPVIFADVELPDERVVRVVREVVQRRDPVLPRSWRAALNAGSSVWCNERQPVARGTRRRLRPSSRGAASSRRERRHRPLSLAREEVAKVAVGLSASKNKNSTSPRANPA